MKTKISILAMLLLLVTISALAADYDEKAFDDPVHIHRRSSGIFILFFNTFIDEAQGGISEIIGSAYPCSCGEWILLYREVWCPIPENPCKARDWVAANP